MLKVAGNRLSDFSGGTKIKRKRRWSRRRMRRRIIMTGPVAYPRYLVLSRIMDEFPGGSMERKGRRTRRRENGEVEKFWVEGDRKGRLEWWVEEESERERVEG